MRVRPEYRSLHRHLERHQAPQARRAAEQKRAVEDARQAIRDAQAAGLIKQERMS